METGRRRARARVCRVDMSFLLGCDGTSGRGLRKWRAALTLTEITFAAEIASEMSVPARAGEIRAAAGRRPRRWVASEDHPCSAWASALKCARTSFACALETN